MVEKVDNYFSCALFAVFIKISRRLEADSLQALHSIAAQQGAVVGAYIDNKITSFQAGCPGCGMTTQQFKNTGRLGCPRCYENFRGDLVPLLQRVHEASQHKGRLPGLTPAAQPPAPRATTPKSAPAPQEDLVALHRSLTARRREAGVQGGLALAALA